ncbi:glycosyltransferase family 4 protein [Corticimicrobacter populi]|uniref:Glycosyl transferase n=1 Tax=Corticimicrobacter populi TaxID=2175229 RepID=A0A2V1JXF7_9BURK|nr:glycosyltransferase family 4 protein [Corticimicrobacter populi]PWF22174.1 glycosyl transferase [Corticimicrobacter populi]
MKICHLTSAHPRYDTRIFLKQCRSLAKAGFETALVVADGKGDETRDGVRFYDVGASAGRLDRMRNTTKRVLAKAVAIDAIVYQLHDPELLPIGLELKKRGKKVVFDAHEDVPKQLLGKPYLNAASRWLLSELFSVYENRTCRKFDGVIAATPFIRDKFLEINRNTVDVNNFPMLGELVTEEIDWSRKRPQVAYVGGISRIRGILELVRAMGLVRSDVTLGLGGTCPEADFKRELENAAGWARVDDRGFLDRVGVRTLLQESVAGVVTLHPVVNYLDALPVKMFEYMSAGIPVIASNFELWRRIVEENQCGLCVDPLHPQEVADAIDYFFMHPEDAERMGRNGQRAIRDHYNWDVEAKKLLSFYDSLLSINV